MRYVITAANGHHLRSESVMTATQGVFAVNTFNREGFAVIHILDGQYRELSLTELQKRAAAEPGKPS